MTKRAWRVLLVDDERGIRVAMGRVLIKAGFDVVPCESGEDAIARMKEATAFDAIITDLKMPGLHGVALIAAIRGVDPQVPIVVLTGHRDSHDTVDLIQAGVSTCLDKPVDVSVLLDALRGVVKREA